MKLQELGQLEQQLAGQQRECAKVQAQLQGMRDAALKYSDIEQDLKCKEHELSLIQERISHSEHHTAELALKDMRDQVATFQAEIPEEKKRLETQVTVFVCDMILVEEWFAPTISCLSLLFVVRCRTSLFAVDTNSRQICICIGALTLLKVCARYGGTSYGVGGGQVAGQSRESRFFVPNFRCE